MCTFGPKVHNLQRENDSVTPRGGAQSLRFFLWNICGPLVSPKNFLSMVAHQAHRLLKWFLLKHENYKKKCRFFHIKTELEITCNLTGIPISCYGWTLLKYIVPPKKGKVRDPPDESYIQSQKFLPNDFLKILMKKWRFLDGKIEKWSHV